MPAINVATIHGILSNGNNSIDLLGKLGAKHCGWNFHEHDYRPVGAIGAMFGRKKRAEKLIESCEGMNLLAHSNGGLLALDALDMGGAFETVILFSPAAEEMRKIRTDRVKRVVVVYNPKDRAILLGARIPGHPFGFMGRSGSGLVGDPKVWNINAMEMVGRSNHGDITWHTGPYFSDKDFEHDGITIPNPLYQWMIFSNMIFKGALSNEKSARSAGPVLFY